MEPRIQYAKTEDGVSIAYWTMGEGQPLVCLPPMIWSHLQLEWQDPPTRAWFEQLAKTRKLVRYDYRGEGLSERNVANHSFDVNLQDLDAVAEHLQFERFSLYGNGPNTPMAIAYAARHPDRVTHLILFNPQLRLLEAGLAGTALLEVAEKDWETYTEAVAQAALEWSEGERAREFAGFIRQSVNQETWLEMIKQFDDIDAMPLLPQVSAPTLVLARPTKRRVFDATKISTLASQMQNARVVFLSGTEPALHLGDTDEGLRAIDEFLSEGEEHAAAAPTIPGGTAIILFADIANSTALTERMGDAAFRDKARDLDTALRKAIASAGGTAVEGKLLGDGVLAVFGAAREAIACSRGCHAAAEENGLELHVGIHAGDVIREEGNVFGGAVNIAARVADASGAGETLVSQTVRDLARTSAGVEFEDRGEHELKGIDEPQRLWSVRWREDG